MWNSYQRLPRVWTTRKAQNLFQPASNTVSGWRALMTHSCSAVGQVLTTDSAGHPNIIMGALEEGGVTTLVPEVTLGLSASEWFVSQRAPEKCMAVSLAHGSFSLPPINSAVLRCVVDHCHPGHGPGSPGIGLSSRLLLKPAGWKRKLIADCADVQAALISDLKWLLWQTTEALNQLRCFRMDVWLFKK